MRLIPDSGTLLLRGRASWLRCAFADMALEDDVVVLAPAAPAAATASGDIGGHAGLAFDRHCRLFHPVPETGALEQVMWGATGNLGVHDAVVRPFPVTGAATEVAALYAAKEEAAALQRPVALAADGRDYLYVADAGAKAVWLVDLWQQEFARRVDFAAAPLDLAACGDAVFVLLDDATVWRVGACDPAERSDWPAVAGAARLTVTAALDGSLLAWVLRDPGLESARIHPLHEGAAGLPLPYCGDLAAAPEEPEYGATLVLARRPGETFQRLRVKGYHSAPLPDLVAPGYDGRGIEPAPDGRIAYWTALGPRLAAPARAQYRSFGRVMGHALDSGHDQCTWGRLLVEACIPAGTHISFRAYSSDSLDYPDPLPRSAPQGESLTTIAEPEATPLLSAMVWQQTMDGPEAEPQSLYRDPSARPLAPATPEGFARFDAPLAVPPGRYLWLVFELTGTRSKSPRLLTARAEYPGHGLLGKLPCTLWREASARDFLFRYLMPVAATLDEWESVSGERHRLLDPRVSPGVALPWLAGFLGLALDPCWPEAVRRRLIAEAAPLFRTRGTVPSLRRMLQILTDDGEVIIIEHFRLRGGGVVGNAEVTNAQAVLGVGFRVGGQVGDAAGPADQAYGTGAPDVAAIADFDGFAHRFTVTLVAALDDAQLECARRLIDMHKPAHTDFALCTAASGIRVGVGAHVGISAVIGQSSGFSQAVVGDAALGGGFLLGRPELDQDSAGGDP